MSLLVAFFVVTTKHLAEETKWRKGFVFPLGSQFGKHSPSQGGHVGGRGSSLQWKGVWPATLHQQTGTGLKVGI